MATDDADAPRPKMAIICERGAIYGPFEWPTTAIAWADENLGAKHGWKLVRLIPVKSAKR